MDAIKAYYYMMQEIFSNGMIAKENISGKRVLLVGHANMYWVNGETICEYVKRILGMMGAKECIVFGLLNGVSIPADKGSNEKYYYGDFTDITEIPRGNDEFDAIIILEGLERVESFQMAAANIKGIVKQGGNIYIIARTPANVAGGPDGLLFWYEDNWRYEEDTLADLFQDDDPTIARIDVGNLHWLFAHVNNTSAPESVLAHRIPMYSCQAHGRIYERMKKDLGYFKDTGLEALGRREVTDKSYYGHNYLSKYEHFLKKFRDEKFTLLELGVYEGASERMWRDYFQQAQIIGVDINPACKQYEEERILIEIADLGKDETLSRLKDYAPAIIVDDASHLWSHQIKALFALFEVLPSGGIYILEDMETAANPEQYPGFNDCQIDSYTVCERLIRVVMSKMPCLEEPFAAEITEIGMATEMAAIVKGSCIFVKR